MACREIETKCQAAAAKLPIVFKWTPACSNLWTAGEVYGLTERVRPTSPNGFEYECTTAGQSSGRKEPNWKGAAAVGLTIDDGSVVWTCRAISNVSLTRTLATSTWPPVTGLTITGDQMVNTLGEMLTSAFVEFSEAVPVSGTKYRLQNTVTFSDGSEDVGEVDIEVE